MQKRTILFLICTALFLTAVAIGITLLVGDTDDLPFIVCLDAGHGFDDVGAVSTDGVRYEKDDNLHMALAVRDILVENGIQVTLTREDDTFLTLEERCKFANRSDASVFVSLHRNSGGGQGAEIWIESNKPAKAKKLGREILDRLVEAGITNNRGVRSGTAANSNSDYAVNSGTDMPSCIVELGFIDNDTDNNYFDQYFDEYAQAIAQGIMAMQ